MSPHWMVPVCGGGGSSVTEMGKVRNEALSDIQKSPRKRARQIALMAPLPQSDTKRAFYNATTAAWLAFFL